MRRPLVSVAAGLAAGVLLGSRGLLPASGWVIAGAALCLISIVFLLIKLRPAWAFAGALAAIAASGAAYAGARTAKESSPALCSLVGSEPVVLRVRGWVADPPAREYAQEGARAAGREDSAKFNLRVTHVLDGGQWRETGGTLRTTVQGSIASGLEYGDELEAAVSARRAAGAKNPGEFDAAQFYERSGIAGIARIPDEKGLHFTGANCGFPGARAIFAFRSRALEVIRGNMPDGPGRIIRSLVLGEQALSDEQTRIFRESGTIHFLAISGQHVGLIAVSLWALLTLAGVGHRGTAGLVMLGCAGYGLIAGLGPSVQRSVIMVAVYCGGFLLARKPDVPNSLALALIILLMLKPVDLFSPGLQLSFVAVLGIWLFARSLEGAIFGSRTVFDRLQAPEEKRWFEHRFRWVLTNTVAVSLVAWLVTAPLILFHFGMFTPIAPVASTLLLPLVSLGITLGLPVALLGHTLGSGAAVAYLPLSWCASALEWSCRAASSIPASSMYLPPPGLFILLLCAAAFLLILARDKLKLRRRKKLRLTPPWIASLILVPALAYLVFSLPQRCPKNVKLHAISVGRGNCMLMRFPDGHNLLFDAGAWRRDDIGERVIVPALWALGVRRIDLLALSHGDADHYNGAAELARRMPVGRVAMTEYFDRKPGAAALVKLFEKRGVDVLRVRAGDHISGFEPAEIDVLWPAAGMEGARWTDNELCAVMRVKTEGGAVLLTGDFGKRAVSALIRENKDLRADVLQVPHHGLADDEAKLLAEAVRPEIAIIPGGAEATATKGAYESASGKVLTTDDNGMVSVEMGGGKRVKTFIGEK